MSIHRRSFQKILLWASATTALGIGDKCWPAPAHASREPFAPCLPDEDVFAYIKRIHGSFARHLYHQILGAANEFKEGDEIVGIAAPDEASRKIARQLLGNTRLRDIDLHPPLKDGLYAYLMQRPENSLASKSNPLTLAELKHWLLTEDEASIKSIMQGWTSEVIGCVVKLMSNEELISVGAKVFNSLPGTNIGAKGYLGARIQPNSPTDNILDIRWQVLDGWSYAVGDVLLGNNPVSSNPVSVAAIQRTLQEVLAVFGVSDAMPHCVLSHIDVQAEVEATSPGLTELWFQSIAGCDSANATFDITVEKMRKYASARSGKFGMYFETGQGADFTNGHAHGFDVVLHEARKYGFARALTLDIAAALVASGAEHLPWVHLNDVAGFIGPEVFRTREQLVRCCLEDIVMGKLHGLCIGLDVCSTLHMDVSLDDLDWCLDQIMPANPAYLMALPTKIDPMLGYLTTSFQDHVRIREKFGTKVNDRMWRFFQDIEVIDSHGRATNHFGDPLWVYQQYCRRKGDARSDQELRQEGKVQLEEVRARGVFVSQGFGSQLWEHEPNLHAQVQKIYVKAKQSIWAELERDFIASIPDSLRLQSRSADRTDYILHPATGELLNTLSLGEVRQLRAKHTGQYDVQIIVSDGLNALAISNSGQLASYLQHLHLGLVRDGFRPAPEHLVVTSGRVRVGYRIGEILFGNLDRPCAVLHVIGERPGTGHDTFSVYITAPSGSVWAVEGKVDHDITRVVSGVATSALPPIQAATESLRLLNSMTQLR